MKIIVCVKQVPDTTEITINPETGTPDQGRRSFHSESDDANALEQALQIRDSQPGTEVVVITMGLRKPEKCCRSASPWARMTRSCCPTGPWAGPIPGPPPMLSRQVSARWGLRSDLRGQTGHRWRHRPGRPADCRKSWVSHR